MRPEALFPPEGSKPERARVSVVIGDITTRRADALLVPTNSITIGNWNGAVDRAIRAKFGSDYHYRLEQQARARGLTDGEVVYVSNFFVTPDAVPPFEGVAFLVDNLEKGLDRIVAEGLADLNAHRVAAPEKVTIPVMRTGAQAWMYPSPMDAFTELTAGIQEFIDTTPNPTIKEIEVVVYPGSELAESLGPIAKRAESE